MDLYEKLINSSFFSGVFKLFSGNG